MIAKSNPICPYCANKIGVTSKTNNKFFCPECGFHFFLDVSEKFLEFFDKMSLSDRDKYKKSLKSIAQESKNMKPVKFLIVLNSKKILEVDNNNLIAKLYNTLFGNVDKFEIVDFFDSLQEYNLPIETKQFIVRKFIQFFDLQKHYLPVFYFVETQIEPLDKNVAKDIYLYFEENKINNTDLLQNRDIFIACSNKDIKITMKLLDALNKKGITYFLPMTDVAKSSISNIENCIKKAIEQCGKVLFINSKNFRSSDCYAYNNIRMFVEYIDKKNIQLKDNGYQSVQYKDLPIQYKKSRVNLFIDDYKGTLQDRYMQEFLCGFVECKTIDEVVKSL